MRKPSSWQLMAGMSLALLCGACTNGGKNLRDSAGMSPGSAGGQVGGAAAPAGSTTTAIPATPSSADSTTSRRDTLGGRMARMMPGAAAHDSMHRKMRDTAPSRRRP